MQATAQLSCQIPPTSMALMLMQTLKPLSLPFLFSKKQIFLLRADCLYIWNSQNSVIQNISCFNLISTRKSKDFQCCFSNYTPHQQHKTIVKPKASWLTESQLAVLSSTVQEEKRTLKIYLKSDQICWRTGICKVRKIQVIQTDAISVGLLSQPQFRMLALKTVSHTILSNIIV